MNSVSTHELKQYVVEDLDSPTSEWKGVYYADCLRAAERFVQIIDLDDKEHVLRTVVKNVDKKSK